MNLESLSFKNIPYNSVYHYFKSLNLEQKIAWVGIALGLILVIIGMLML